MTDTPDEGRLELDDAGGVVDGRGAPLVDLADPDATDLLAASRLESWVSGTAAPWVRARRRPVAAVVAVAVAVTLGGAWWASRPGPPPPPPVLTLTNAPAVGGDVHGDERACGDELERRGRGRPVGCGGAAAAADEQADAERDERQQDPDEGREPPVSCAHARSERRCLRSLMSMISGTPSKPKRLRN